MAETKCFDIYTSCITAIHDGKLITPESSRDKEFHFQNWCQQRLEDTGLNYDIGGRNSYPDFHLVKLAEGYEIKGLAYPGRERDFDANSNVPTGSYNGREIFYIFGRYPADLTEYRTKSGVEYPVIDLVICHGDFLSANHDYIHENKHVSGFGTYGDIMIRDRKMYVVPTPFALTTGTTGLSTLIVPNNYTTPKDFICVGELTRVECDKLVIGYEFNLTTNKMVTNVIENPNAGQKHHFKALRHISQANKAVTMK